MSEQLSSDPKIAMIAAGAVSAEALQKAEKFIEEEEGATHKIKGWVAVELFFLYKNKSVF